MGKYSSGKAVASADDWRAVLAGKQTTAIVLASVMPIVKLTQTPQISQQPSADQSGDQSIKIGLFSVAASESVSEVGKGMDNIANAASEQQRAGAEVAAGIEKIAAMTQDNSDAASQTATAARSLEALAEEQQSTVGRFKI